MDYESTLSIVGSIASIVSVIGAVIAALKSRKWAKESQNIRDQLIVRRNLSEVAVLRSESKRVLNIVAEIGPASNPRKLRGMNGSVIASEVQKLIAVLLESRSALPESVRTATDSLSNNIRKYIEQLAQSTQPIDLKTHGTKIFYLLQSYVPLLKETIDEGTTSIE